jgi:hypothetical protein
MGVTFGKPKTREQRIKEITNHLKSSFAFLQRIDKDADPSLYKTIENDVKAHKARLKELGVRYETIKK